MTTLHVATIQEWRVLLSNAWGYLENQIESDSEDPPEDWEGFRGDYVSPVQEDRRGLVEALEEVNKAGVSFPLALELDPILGSEEVEELRFYLEVMRDDSHWQDVLDDNEQDLGAAFTARLEG